MDSRYKRLYNIRFKIKEKCKEGGVYEPCCDKMIEELSDLMDMLKDFTDEYEKAKQKGDFDKQRECAIRKADLHKTCMNYWRELLLTPKAYKEFIKNNGESDKDNKLLALLQEDAE